MPSEWIIFEEMSSFNTKKFIKNCTVISPMSVALFTNAMRIPQDSVDKTGGKNVKTSFVLRKFVLKVFIADDDYDSNEENDTLVERNLAILTLDGWTSFIGNSDDISKIFNMRLCLTLAYREFLKHKMISPHSVIICFKCFIRFLIIINIKCIIYVF